MNIGKVVLVPFPWDDFSSQKVRPALCLTEPRGEFRQIVVAYIGSRIPEDILDTDVILSGNDLEINRSGLHKTSVIRVHRLITIQTSSIKSEIGSLSDRHLAKVKRAVKRLFKLNGITRTDVDNGK